MHKNVCFFQRVHVQNIQGPIFWGKKNACGNAVGGMVLFRMTSNIKELLKLSIRVDFGTVKGHWGEFPRRKIMIGVWRTRLDGSRGPNKP